MQEQQRFAAGTMQLVVHLQSVDGGVRGFRSCRHWLMHLYVLRVVSGHPSPDPLPAAGSSLLTSVGDATDSGTGSRSFKMVLAHEASNQVDGSRQHYCA